MIQPATPPPPKEALAYLRAKGYKIGWDYWDVWREEHVHAFTVAKAMTQDLLIDIRKALDEALAQGQTFRQFKKEIEPILGKRGWLGKVTMPDGATVELGTPRRLKIIYDTNMRTARTAGQWQRIERNKDALPYLMYSLGPSREHRLQHTAWDGLVLAVDDTFWNTHMPPNGWGCRCRVRQLTKRDADRRGGIAKTPKIETTPWQNKRTGQLQEVPTGIDPGWDYNPGKVRSGKAQQFSQDKDAEFKRIVGTAAAAVKVERRAIPSAMSTLKNISAENIDDVLQQLPAAEDRLKKVIAFTNAKGTKTLIIRQAEMGRLNSAAMKIREQVLAYLDKNQHKYGTRNYTINGHGSTDGFSGISFNHVVIKGNSKVNFNTADNKGLAVELNQAVAHAAATRKKIPRNLLEKKPELAQKPEVWTLGYSGSKEAKIIATWVHELGHQVHYWAGAPDAPTGSKYLTKYSQANKYEYHAEHFSAWLFNRDGLAKFDPAAAKHFDELIEKAIQGKHRTR